MCLRYEVVCYNIPHVIRVRVHAKIDIRAEMLIANANILAKTERLLDTLPYTVVPLSELDMHSVINDDDDHRNNLSNWLRAFV